MSSSVEGNRLTRISVSDDVDGVSIQDGQTRLRQSEHTSMDPLQGQYLQYEEGKLSLAMMYINKQSGGTTR